MPENYALYSRTLACLPEGQMQALAAGVCPIKAITERGVTYYYKWQDLTVICSEMPREGLTEHIDGFIGYIYKIHRGNIPARIVPLIQFLRSATLVVGVELVPKRDIEERSEEILGKMVNGLMAIVFYDNAIYDSSSLLLLGPDGSYDPEATIE